MQAQWESIRLKHHLEPAFNAVEIASETACWGCCEGATGSRCHTQRKCVNMKLQCVAVLLKAPPLQQLYHCTGAAMEVKTFNVFESSGSSLSHKRCPQLPAVHCAV